MPKILLNSLLSNEFRSIFSKDVLKRFKTMIDLIDFDKLFNKSIKIFNNIEI